MPLGGILSTDKLVDKIQAEMGPPETTLVTGFPAIFEMQNDMNRFAANY